MNDDIFRVLDAISHGEPCENPESERWIRALRTICWVTPSSRRLALTADGLEAYRELESARRNSSRTAPV
jgi:hypothetical protein